MASTEYRMSALRQEIKTLKGMATAGCKGRVYFDEPYLQFVNESVSLVVPYHVAEDNGDFLPGQVACAL